MAKTYEEILIEFDYESHAFGADDDQVIIGRAIDGVVIKGKCHKGEFETGLSYRLYGFWTEHPKYGKQFVFISKTLAVPSGQRGTVAYLQRGPGIGKKRAMQIWAKYGSDSLAAIRERPEEVSASVAGLTPEKCREAAEYFEKLAGLEAVTIELTDLFGSRGFPRKLTEQVIERWGNQAPRIIRENPYVLLDGFRGVGFVRADQLYLELKLPPDAIDRQGYCIWHALHSDNEGHTWLKQEQCIGHLNKNIAGGEVQAQPAIEWALKNRKIARRVDESGQIWLADYGRAASEKKIASILHRAELVDASKLQWPELE